MSSSIDVIGELEFELQWDFARALRSENGGAIILEIKRVAVDDNHVIRNRKVRVLLVVVTACYRKLQGVVLALRWIAVRPRT